MDHITYMVKYVGLDSAEKLGQVNPGDASQNTPTLEDKNKNGLGCGWDDTLWLQAP